MLKKVTGIALLCMVSILPAFSTAKAAFAWAYGGISSADYNIGAGVQLLPIPLIGSFGVEAALEKSWKREINDFSLAAVVRDVQIPLTTVDLFASAGLRIRQTGSDPFLEVGLRTPFTDFANAVGIRVSARGYLENEARFGIGLEVRF
jgi:hypothetical protein